jgi:hypothetical protein
VPKSVVAKSLAEELMVFRERLRFAKTWDISVTHDGGYRLTRPGNVGLTGPGFSMVALFQGALGCFVRERTIVSRVPSTPLVGKSPP